MAQAGSNSGPGKTPKAKADTRDRDDGKAPAGSHLQRRIERNSDLTEKSQSNPNGGGAHSGTPDPTNP